MISKLFVYGSLMAGLKSPIATYLSNNSQFLGTGLLEGTLYDLGKYPGIIPQENSDNWVKGHVFELSKPSMMLPVLDRYEGVGEGFSVPTEYIRVLSKVLIGSESMECWVYQYNYATEAFSVIASGDYLQYFQKNKAFQDFVNSQIDYTR